MGVGRIDGVAASTGFSHKKKIVWSFRRDIKKVTIRRGSHCMVFPGKKKVNCQFHSKEANL